LRDSLRSDRLGVRRVQVELPRYYNDPLSANLRYPVVILFDAEDNALFSRTTENWDFLEGAIDGALPPVIVVGVIGKGGDQLYSPATGAMALRRPGAAECKLAPPPCASADDLGAFVTTELLPWVRAKFRALPYTVLVGTSASGQFVLRQFARNPSEFNAAVAVSPALWWNDEADSRVYAKEIAERRQNGRLFVSVSGGDPLSLGNAVEHFAKATSDWKKESMAFDFRRYPADNHHITMLGGYVEGLRFVFEPVSLAAAPVFRLADGYGTDSTTFFKAFAETKDKYARGAEALGLPKALPAAFLWTFSRVYFLRQRDVIVGDRGVGRRLCFEFIALYPDMPNARECLADAMLALGDSAGTRQQLIEGLAAARKLAASDYEASFEQRLARLDSVRAKLPDR
jgi:predicted alpha/beta superfamily hydrolase